MNLELLAGRIRERRIARHITQAEMAQRLGVTPQTVSKWERGLCAPDLDNLIDLAAMLSCSVDYLLSPESECPRRCFIAVDGGGTKTEMLLFAEDGHILKRYLTGSTNPNAVGAEEARSQLLTGMDMLMNIEMPCGIFAGIAGVLSGGYSESMQAALAAHCGNIPVRVTSDILNVIHSVRGVEKCIAVICGTGSSVFAYDGENIRRYGGWGYLFDGAGSGYDIGRDVLCACFALSDGFGQPSLVTDLAQERLGCPPMEKLGAFYAEGRDKIAAFAPVAFDAYRRGDRTAAEILQRNAERVAMLIRAADNGSDTVIISGGLTCHRDVLEPMLLERLPERMKLIFPTLPQIYGAALAAMQTADIPGDPAVFDKNFQNDYAALLKG